MRKILPFIIILALVLTGCGDFAVEATATPSAATEYSFSTENYPEFACSDAIYELSKAITAIMLGTDRESAEEYVATGTSTAAWDALESGEAGIVVAVDAGNVPENAETAAIAADALVFYVSEDNPVTNLSVNDLTEIFSGEVANWAEYGGEDCEILVKGRQEGSASIAAVETLIGGEMVETKSEDGIETSSGVIGFGFYYPTVTLGLADGYKIIEVDGIAPSAETVQSGEYKLTVTYLAGIMSDAAEDSPERTLYSWLQGAVGQAFISSQGCFDASYISEEAE